MPADRKRNNKVGGAFICPYYLDASSRGVKTHPCKGRCSFDSENAARDHVLRIHIKPLNCSKCFIRFGLPRERKRHEEKKVCNDGPHSEPDDVPKYIVDFGQSVKECQNRDALNNVLWVNGVKQYDYLDGTDELGPYIQLIPPQHEDQPDQQNFSQASLRLQNPSVVTIIQPPLEGPGPTAANPWGSNSFNLSQYRHNPDVPVDTQQSYVLGVAGFDLSQHVPMGSYITYDEGDLESTLLNPSELLHSGDVSGGGQAGDMGLGGNIDFYLELEELEICVNPYVPMKIDQTNYQGDGIEYGSK